MTSHTAISGIHHITAMTASAAHNRMFYENILGLRLVKKTVNFDDPYTYHLYYGDAHGSPGTILTFFPWENQPQGKPGAGMVTAVAFAVPENSMDFWTQRIHASGAAYKNGRRFDDPVIEFTDPHGLPLELVGTSHWPETGYWKHGPIVEAHAIKGFHSATATLNHLDDNKTLMTDVMGFNPADQENNRYRFVSQNDRAPGNVFDLVVDPDAAVGRPGSGTVHHIAFRAETDAAQSEWQSILKNAGVHATGVRDRNYFKSIYFHSPGRVLFEIATDPPGFTVDEPPDRLGTSLKLPQQYESIRKDIENHLPPMFPAPFQHIFKKAPNQQDSGHTLVTLHGTGGTENDIAELAEDLSGGAAILSPRGKVKEHGMSRFFNRLANNVFDEKDVVSRAHELSDFIRTSAARFDRDPQRFTALGYSNGANIASAILLLRPETFSRAVLVRPMLPLTRPMLPDLRGKAILVLKGTHDTIIPSASTDELVLTLEQAGADVTIEAVTAGHEITPRELKTISSWLSGQATQYTSDPVSDRIVATM